MRLEILRPVPCFPEPWHTHRRTTIGDFKLRLAAVRGIRVWIAHLFFANVLFHPIDVPGIGRNGGIRGANGHAVVHVFDRLDGAGS